MSSDPAESTSSPSVSEARAAAQERPKPVPRAAGAAHPHHAEPPPGPTLTQVLLAPWVGIVRPGPAAQHFVAARGLDLLLALLFTTLVASAALLTIQLGHGMRELRLTAPDRQADTPAKQMNWHYVIRERGFGEILEEWYLDVLWPGLAVVWITTGLVLLASTGALGLLMSARVRRVPGRRVAPVLLRAAASTLGLMVTVWVALSAVELILRFAAMDAVALVYTGATIPFAHRFAYDSLSNLLVPVWLVVVIFRSLRVAAGLDLGPVTQRAPRTLCEECGYDLRLLPPGGRCPECGLPLASSLEADQARPGIGWERHRSIASWLKTTWLVMVRPTRFYRRLPIRSGDRGSRSFALSQALGLIVALVLLFATLAVGLPSGSGFGFWMELVAGQGLPIRATTTLLRRLPAHVTVALLIYLVSATVIARFWAWRKVVPEPRCAAKVLDYEAVWLWVFLLAALAGTAGQVLIDLRTRRLGMPVWGGGLMRLGPPDLRPALAGAGLALLLWLIRLRTVRKAIRWANF